MPSNPKLELRPEVAAFAQLMEQKLRENDHKGGWADDPASALVERVVEEAAELAEEWGSPRPSFYTVWEAVDVANMAMMVADVLGGVDHE